MINKTNIRAIYKPDAQTKDGILYFYLVEKNYELMWQCEKYPEIEYFTDIPFLDDDWEIQQRTNLQTIDGQYVYENDVILFSYKEDENGDVFNDEGKIYINKDGYWSITRENGLDCYLDEIPFFVNFRIIKIK